MVIPSGIRRRCIYRCGRSPPTGSGRRWSFVPGADARFAVAWSRSKRRAALEQVAIAWANTDLPAASSWVRALPENEGKHAAILAPAYETARTEPVAALVLTSSLPPTRERDDLLVHAVSQWAGTDSTTAAAWALEVADPTLQERRVAAVAFASAEQDGATAATRAANALGPGAEQNRATVSIVQRWAQATPQAAAYWVSQFPDIPSRVASVENLMALWTAQDAGAAGNWLRQLPPGALRDLGITASAQALADRDPTSAMVSPTGGLQAGPARCTRHGNHPGSIGLSTGRLYLPQPSSAPTYTRPD